MKKLRRAHLWIGLIASIFIFMEALTGLLMNEPWLIGQTTVESGRGNFQMGQFYQGQANGQNQGQASGQTQGQANNGQTQGQTGFSGNGQFQGRQRFGGNGNFTPGMRGGASQGIVGTIRNLHQGRIGNTDIKWLIDLVALAMMCLTGTGVYLSIKVISAERKMKKRREENLEVL